MSKHFNFLILLTLLACTETSNKIPVFEANINGNFNWNAQTFVAIVQNNGIAISGSDNASSISLIINNLDVGNSALYLLSDMAGGVTGEIHYVDAGYNKVGMPDPKNISE